MKRINGGGSRVGDLVSQESMIWTRRRLLSSNRPEYRNKSRIEIRKRLLASVAVLLLTSLAFPAHALTTSASDGSFSSQAGASIVDFGISPDVQSTVSFYDGRTLLGSFDELAINGNQTSATYFKVFAGEGEAITKVTFESTTNAFATDNHAFISAIPEPKIYSMMLAGLGLMGFVAGRRRQQDSAA